MQRKVLITADCIILFNDFPARAGQNSSFLMIDLCGRNRELYSIRFQYGHSHDVRLKSTIPAGIQPGLQIPKRKLDSSLDTTFNKLKS